MAWVLRKIIYLDKLAECVLCSRGEEYCKHIFFPCPFAHRIWATQGIPLVDASSEMAFWDSVR